MKRTLALTLLFFLCITQIVAAPNKGVVKGKIIEKQTSEPLAFATVSIHYGDSTVVAGATTSENGLFTIDNLPQGEYTVKVSFIGFKDYTMPLTVGMETLDLGTLEVEEDVEMLASAVVTEKVPVIEQKMDKLVMNVSEAVSTAGSNGVDILRKAPGVSIDHNGNVKLNGSTVEVWIDGRPSYLSGKELESLLMSTDGNTIDKIEIISHPSAKYDAAGSGGIINIKTKKNFMKGFNGTISAGYGGMYFDRYNQAANGTLSLGYRSEKTNTFFSYSPRYQDITMDLDTWTLFGEDYNMKQVSHTDYLAKNSSHQFRFGNDWFITKKDIFGFIVTSSLRDGSESNYGTSFTETYMDDKLLFRQESEIDNPSDFGNISANLNYTRTFDEAKGQELTVNADYGYYDIGNGNYQTNIYVDPLTKAALPDPVIFRTDSRQYINMVSAKADYQQMFWKTGSLEFGAKWAETFTGNNTLREDMLNDIWKKNDNLSNKFKYNEQIAAVYASAAKMFGQKWVVKLGLRSEYTYAKGDWISANEKSSKSYIDLFPTVYAGYNPSQNWRFSLSYTMRINRPSFSQLNPFRSYADANTSTQGNPYLNPQYTDQLTLGVGFKSYLNLTAIYQHTRNLIMQNPYLEESGEKVLRWDNFGSQDLLGATLSVTELPIFKWWVFNGSFLAAYNTNNSTSDDNFTNNGLLTNAYGNFTFLLPKDWKIEFGAFFQGTTNWGYFKVDPQYMFFGGVKKNFMEGRATLALNVEDVFRNYCSNLIAINTDGKQYYGIDQRYDLQRITVSFTYRFGQVKHTRQRNVGNMEESERVGGGSGISSGSGSGMSGGQR